MKKNVFISIGLIMIFSIGVFLSYSYICLIKIRCFSVLRTVERRLQVIDDELRCDSIKGISLFFDFKKSFDNSIKAFDPKSLDDYENIERNIKQE